MMGCALGDVLPAARHTAERYGVPLTSVEDYARAALR
jgi:hypothetical protein